VYVDALKASPDALRASFDYYRAIDQDIEQNKVRKATKLDLPILAIGGGVACGEGVENEMRSVANDVKGVVIPGCGHFAPEEAPEAFTAALLDFFAPYEGIPETK
jgi:pimeloyl-ACP methyl ester carboxylesterase